MSIKAISEFELGTITWGKEDPVRVIARLIELAIEEKQKK